MVLAQPSGRQTRTLAYQRAAMTTAQDLITSAARIAGVAPTSEEALKLLNALLSR